MGCAQPWLLPLDYSSSAFILLLPRTPRGTTGCGCPVMAAANNGKSPGSPGLSPSAEPAQARED